MLGLLVWLAGILWANRLPVSIPVWGNMALGGHTASSIWLRLLSIPLRIAIVWQLGLAIWGRHNGSSTRIVATQEVQPLMAAWATCGLFYASDIYLFSLAYPLWIAAPVLLVLSTVWATTFLHIRVSALATGLMFGALAFGIWQSQAQSTENHAFTTFGLQGLALIMGMRGKQACLRSLKACYLIPTLGYIFPFFEKMLLNPWGWLSGQTLGAYAQIYTGQTPGQALCIVLSWLLLAFQGSFIGLLFKPSQLPWLFGVAMGFHIMAGVILGFPGILSPWVSALGIGWVAFVNSRNGHTPAQTASVVP